MTTQAIYRDEQLVLTDLTDYIAFILQVKFKYRV